MHMKKQSDIWSQMKFESHLLQGSQFTKFQTILLHTLNNINLDIALLFFFLLQIVALYQMWW